MNDACSFASDWQGLDTELAAARHENHQGNQRAAADLICLVFTWVLLTVPDFKERGESQKKGEWIFLLPSLSNRIFVLKNASDTSH